MAFNLNKNQFYQALFATAGTELALNNTVISRYLGGGIVTGPIGIFADAFFGGVLGEVFASLFYWNFGEGWTKDMMAASIDYSRSGIVSGLAGVLTIYFINMYPNLQVPRFMIVFIFQMVSARIIGLIFSRKKTVEV